MGFSLSEAPSVQPNAQPLPVGLLHAAPYSPKRVVGFERILRAVVGQPVVGFVVTTVPYLVHALPISCAYKHNSGADVSVLSFNMSRDIAPRRDRVRHHALDGNHDFREEPAAREP